MNPLDLVKLPTLMERSSGKAEVRIGLIDGPVAMDHPDLASTNIREIPGQLSGRCMSASSAACIHGTFVAGILSASRNSAAPAICPDCTLLVRPVFTETAAAHSLWPSATPKELAAAIVDCIEAGAQVLNLSVALSQPSLAGQRELEEAFHYAAGRGAIIVAAAGNQGTLGSSVITRHRWVIPVVAYDLRGRPAGLSNFGHSIGQWGLGAPSNGVTSLSTTGAALSLDGTSIATPFVSGTIALLWSIFPDATASDVKVAVTQAQTPRRTSVVPPLLNAWAAYQMMEHRGRR